MTLSLTLPELLLALYLLLVLPAQAIRRSRQPRDRPRMAIYLSNITRLVLLLLALAACALWSGYTARQMGLEWPPGVAGQWGLAAAVAALAALHIGGTLYERRMPPEKRKKSDAMLREQKAMPTTPRELAVFAVLSVLLGVGWELLYRGFLLLVLAPVTGMAGAVTLAALAYGAGHGYNGLKPFIAGIVSAFAFTLAYVWTGSLWWLMVIHTALPLFAGWSVYRKAAAQPATPTCA